MNTSHSGDVKDAASEEKRYQIYVRNLAKKFDWFKSKSSSHHLSALSSYLCWGSDDQPPEIPIH